MNLQITGTIELPEGMTEDQFSDLFYAFLDENKLSFGGGWFQDGEVNEPVENSES